MEFTRLLLETANMRVPTIAEARVVIPVGNEDGSPGYADRADG